MSSTIKVNNIQNLAGDDSGFDLSTNDQVDIKTANTTRVRVNSSGNVGIGTSSPSGVLDIRNGTTQQVIIGNSGSYTGSEYAELLFKESSTELARLKWNPSGNTFQLINRIAGPITFATSDTERMRIDGDDGNLMLGTTTLVGAQSGNVNSMVALYQAGQIAVTNNASDFSMFVNKRDNTGGGLIRFRYNGSTVGSITNNTSSVTYNTSSDYRLKENVNYDFDATSRLKKLKPSRFNFIADADTTVDGFLAHEVSSIVPEAISGEKDAVDKDGNIDPQGIDQSKLVPLLTKALQEAIAKIETLEAKVTALEGK